MMQKLVTTAALCALAGAAYAADGFPARAPIYATQPLVTGDIEVGLGRFYPPTRSDVGVFTGTARANMPLQGPMNLELQSSGNALYFSGASMQWMDVYGHAWWRSPSSAWGIFG